MKYLLGVLISVKELAEAEVRLQCGLDRASANQGSVIGALSPCPSAPATLSYQVWLPQEGR